MAYDLTQEEKGLTPDEMAKQTLDRLDASRTWMNENFWPEWAEVYQGYKCRVDPILDPKTGKEDVTRTNVAMPDIFIAIRKKSARMSRRPPNIRVRAKDDQVSEFLSNWSMFQWDRANEQRFQRRHVMQGNLFGVSLKIHWWDSVLKARKYRHATDQILDRLYVSLDEATGAMLPVSEGDRGAMRGDRLPEDLQASLIAMLGPETVLPEEIARFEGPVSTLPFIGDWYPEPELDSLHGSAWHIFEDIKDAEFIAYWATQTYVHPETGEERPVFSPEAIKELEDEGPYNPKGASESRNDDFKQRLRDVIFKNRPLVDVKLMPGRRYLVHTEFTFRKGICWCRFIANRKVFLGEYPLQFDLDGQYPLSAFVPIEDLFSLIGDSTPRIGKHLYRLHNVTVSQRTDLVTAALKPVLLLPRGQRLPDEMIDTGLFRVVYVDNPRDFAGTNLMQNFRVPPEAWQSEAQIVRMLQQLEPQLTNFGEESQTGGASDKRATIALLQQRSQESLSSEELEALNQSIADETEIKLLMFQQLQENRQVELTGWKPKETYWSTQTAAGPERPRKLTAQPLELQQDFQVFPEIGSTLALDDELRRRDAVQVYQLAVSAPEIWDVRAAAKTLARTFVGVVGDDLVKPPPEPKPQTPEIKMSVSLSMKWEELDPALQAQLLPLIGFTPPPDMDMMNIAKKLKTLAEAGKASQELLSVEQPANANGGGSPR